MIKMDALLGYKTGIDTIDIKQDGMLNTFIEIGFVSMKGSVLKSITPDEIRKAVIIELKIRIRELEKL